MQRFHHPYLYAAERGLLDADPRDATALHRIERRNASLRKLEDDWQV
jgi:hypothetical protein